MASDGLIAASPPPATLASWQTLLDALPGAAVIVNHAGQIVLVNAATEQLFGYRRTELLGQALARLLPEWARAADDHRRIGGAATAAAWQAGNDQELTGRRKDGSELLVTAHRNPVPAAEGFVAWFIRDFSLVAPTRARQQYLADAGARLTSALDYATRGAVLAQLVVPTLADFCSVTMADEHGALRQRAAAHADPAQVTLVEDLGAYPPDPTDPGDIVAQVLRTGQRAYLPDIPAGWLEHHASDPERRRRLRVLAPRALLGLPLAARGHVLGALLLGMAGSGRTYQDDDLALADELARRAALSLDNARLHAAEQAARAAADQLAAERVAILKHINDGVITTDGAGRLTFVNAAARRLLGWSEDAAIDDVRLDDIELLRYSNLINLTYRSR